MSIVLFLGRNVKEYGESGEDTIRRLLYIGAIRCELCTRPMALHSRYQRGIKETGQTITIIMAWCSRCRKWHALMPDFLLPHKQYSGDEIESVVIDCATSPVKQIETEASESTARRWIRQIGGRVRRAVGMLKHIYLLAGQGVSEAAIDAGQGYSELEQVLEMAPSAIRYSGNRLGLANLWLGTNRRDVYI